MNTDTLVDNPPLRVKRCRNGVFMYNKNDAYIGRSLDVYGEFSELESELFRHILQPGMTALDIGANIGVHTVAMAQMVGEQGRVVAIEPQRIIYQMLCGNLALNNVANTVTLMVGIGRENGMINLPVIDYNRQNNFGGVSLSSYAAGETVQLVTIDAMNLPHCNFIKLDVEGMELEALQGALQTIRKHKPILYVENDRPEKSEPMLRFLLSEGYRLFWHLPMLFNANNFYGVAENIFPGLASINVLGLPASLMGAELKNFVEITAENAGKYLQKN